MKDLLVATLIVVLLVGSWLGFFHYAEQRLDTLKTTCQEKILPTLKGEDWTAAHTALKELEKDWHAFKKIAYFFLNTNVVNEIDCNLKKSIEYADAEDVSNSTGEVSAMVQQFRFLCANDRLNLQNIF